MAYQKKTWTNDISELSAENFNPMEEGIFGAYPVQLIAIDSTAPSTCATGDKYYNTTSKKIFTATGTNTWGTDGETPLEDTAYWLISENGSYAWNGTDLVSIGGGKAEVVISDEEPEEGKLWVDTAEIQTIAGRDRLVNVSTEVDDTYRVNLLHSKNLLNNSPSIWIRNNSENPAFTDDTNQNRIRTKQPQKLEANKTYTISGIPSGITLGLVKFYASASSTTVTSSTSTNTFTVPANATYVIFQFNGENFTDETKTTMGNANIMLNEGSTATTYEPFIQNKIVVDNEKYSDTLNVGTSVDSRSRVNVLYSHNLLDTSKAQVGVTWAGFSNSDRGRYVINEGGTYTISCESLGNVTASIMIANSDYSSTTDLQDINVGSNITLQFSTGSHLVIQYAKTNITKSDIESAKIMIVEGSTSRTYEPYIAPSIYVDNEEIYSKVSNSSGIDVFIATTDTSISSASFVELTNSSRSFKTVKENSTVICFVRLGGITNNSNSYDVLFKMQMDNSQETSVKQTNRSDWGANWTTTNDRISLTDMFVFTNVPAGNHTFKMLWSSANNNTTATIGKYARYSVTFVEI